MGANNIGSGRKTIAFPNRGISLGSGQSYLIPSGQYLCSLGLYTFLQYFDPVTNTWLNAQCGTNDGPFFVSSDGSNYRLANLTGCMVGAVITNGGTGYTNGIYFPSNFPINNANAVAQAGTATAPSVTVAAGGGSIVAQANLVVGGAINTTVAITAAGSAYTRAPVLTFSPPPPGGVQATAVCTISAGAINAVTVTNQGAGYTTAPTITVTNASDDSTGSGGVLTVNPILVGSGAVTAITMANFGAGMTSVPALTFGPASTTAATAIMCFTSTAVTSTGASNLANGSVVLLTSGRTAGSATLTNPAISTGFYNPRFGICAPATAAGAQSIIDGGLHQTVVSPVMAVNSNGTISAATTYGTNNVGGVNDTSFLLPI